MCYDPLMFILCFLDLSLSVICSVLCCMVGRWLCYDPVFLICLCLLVCCPSPVSTILSSVSSLFLGPCPCCDAVLLDLSSLCWWGLGSLLRSCVFLISLLCMVGPWLSSTILCLLDLSSLCCWGLGPLLRSCLFLICLPFVGALAFL